MDIASTIPYDGGDFRETCDYCGCVYRVQVTLQSGHNDSEEYWCPECRKESKIRASITPRVTLISSRTDNRSNNY